METMTDKKPQPNKPNTALRDELDTMSGIPGRLIRFTLPREPDLGLETWNGTGRNAVMANERITITWLVKVQMYRIVERALTPNKPDRVIYVPQSWGAFE